MNEDVIEKSIGLHRDRLKPNANNPREVVFVDNWHQQNSYSNTLNHLFEVACDRTEPGSWSRNFLNHADSMKMPLGEPTERDRIVAETVIQWLGSNVGHAFIRDCLSECGYEVVKSQKEQG